MIVRGSGLCAAAAAASLAGVWAAQAQTPAEFYKGKTVNIIVGFTPGGGYDQYARLLARHIGKHMPGNPTFVVQNAPGAGSLTAVRRVEGNLPKDGTAVVTFNPALITEGITEPERTKFNFTDVAYIGSITRDFRVCYMWGAKGIKTWDEVMAAKELNFGGTGKGTGSYVNGAILRNVFGAKIKHILGFPGSAEQRLAIERGELDGDCGSFSSIPDDWVRDKKINVFVMFSPVKTPDMPDTPYIANFAKTEEQKAVLQILSAAGELGRPYIVSKSVPADRVAALRQAFDETMKDKDFLAEAKKENLPVYPVGGKEAGQIVEQIYKFPKELVEKAKQAAD
ncbi:MAG: Bug family tripartite tricarboxylate transporter substrate binding protein [Beijerinckiaceae bacterium]